MARSIAADQSEAFRAVHTAKRAYDGEIITWHEGVYNKRSAATGRITFWRNYYKRLTGEYISGRVDRAQIVWEPV